MDDLTRLKGIGAATAKALAAAGYDSFAKLAAAAPEEVSVSPALRGIRASLGDLAAWRAEAAGIAAREGAPYFGEDIPGRGEDSLGAQAPAAEAKPRVAGPGEVQRPAHGPAARDSGETSGRGGEPVPTGPGPMVTIRSTRRRGHWRAGRFWGSEPVTVAIADFDDASQRLLVDDPAIEITAGQ